MPLIEPGTAAPQFALSDQAGHTHALADYTGRPVVLYFYPKDDTPGCTKQACGFRDAMPQFASSKAVIFGVSPDDVESHAKFAEKFDLPFTLLADTPGDDGTAPVCHAYGVWQERSMYGRTFMGVVRTTYLIDAEGKVAKRWDKVKVDDHADEVLAAIESLESPAA